jgi:hypothetical protein
VKPLRRVDWAAIGFALTAVLFLVLRSASDTAWVVEWAPNLAVEALSIAATILIVDRIVRREERRRLRPRLESAYRGIGRQVRSFLHGVAREYVKGHGHPDEADPRRFALALDAWLRAVGTDNVERRVDDGLPYLFHSASYHAEQLAAIADRDREILPPELVAAIDRLQTQLDAARGGFELMRVHSSLDRGIPRAADPLVIAIEEVRAFISAFRAHAESEWLEAYRTVMGSLDLRKRMQERTGRRLPAARLRKRRGV